MDELTKETKNSPSSPPPAPLKLLRAALFRFWQTQLQRWIRTTRAVLVDLAVIALAIILFNTLADELLVHRTEIDPIDIPKSLSEEGLTPRIAAENLADKVVDIEEGANTTKTRSGTTVLPENGPDVVVPGIGLSITSIAYFIRELIGDHVTHVSGYIAEPSTNNYELHLRIDGRPLHDIDGKRLPVLRARSIDQLDKMWTDGALDYLLDTEPYFVAAYDYDFDKEEAERLAKKIISKATGTNENVLRAHNLLGLILRSRGHSEDAIDEFREVISLAGSRFSVVKFSAPYAYSNLGFTLNDEGKYTEALVALQKAILLDPKSANAYGNIAVAQSGLGHNVEAIAAYQTSLMLDPKVAYRYYNLGVALFNEVRYAEAAAAFRKDVDMDPNADGYDRLGLALSYAEGRNDEAIAAFQKEVDLDPKRDEGYVHLADLLISVGRRDEAITAYQKEVDMDPKREEGYIHLADLLISVGRRDEAIAVFQDYVEMDPNREAAYVHLADLLTRVGRRDEAIAAYRTAIALNPKIEETYEDLGFILLDTRQLDVAIVNYDELLKVNSESDVALYGRGVAKGLMGDNIAAVADIAAAEKINPFARYKFPPYRWQFP